MTIRTSWLLLIVFSLSYLVLLLNDYLTLKFDIHEQIHKSIMNQCLPGLFDAILFILKWIVGRKRFWGTINGRLRLSSNEIVFHTRAIFKLVKLIIYMDFFLNIYNPLKICIANLYWNSLNVVFNCGFDRGCNDIVRNLFRILINDLKKKMNFGV